MKPRFKQSGTALIRLCACGTEAFCFRSAFENKEDCMDSAVNKPKSEGKNQNTAERIKKTVRDVGKTVKNIKRGYHVRVENGKMQKKSGTQKTCRFGFPYSALMT